MSAGFDICEKIISRYYEYGMLSETWGRTSYDEFCPPFYEYRNANIDEISIGNYSRTSNNDHSKWSVGLSKQFVCYTDINKIKSPRARGEVHYALFTQIFILISEV